MAMEILVLSIWVHAIPTKIQPRTPEVNYVYGTVHMSWNGPEEREANDKLAQPSGEPVRFI
jgi:hypothetical protein